MCVKSDDGRSITDAQMSLAQRLALLPAGARVLDVGGGRAPCRRANVVMDAVEYEAVRNAGGLAGMCLAPDAWIQRDICDRTPWPFPDRAFDFAVCTHVLEDVRDPVWVCREMSRVAKAGYIVTPSRYVEQSLGVENPCYAGYYHHRWLVESKDGELVFRHKPHLLHSRADAIVARLDAFHQIRPELATVEIEWREAIRAREELEFDERRTLEELRAFAGKARSIEGLVVRRREPFRVSLRRLIYYSKLRLARP